MSLLEELPEAVWHQYEACGRDNVRAGAKLAFGEYVDTIYRFDRADIVLSLDADFLHGMPGSLAYARAFIDGRRVSDRSHRAAPDESPGAAPRMNRLYSVESVPGLTGAMADHRLRLAPSEVEAFARSVAEQLDIPIAADKPSVAAGVPAKWLTALVGDLRQHRGR